MNLRTFIPPPSVPTAAAPRPGEPAPELGPPLRGRPTVVAFLRHIGCPFAEATFKQLRDTAEREADVRFIAVSHAPRAATDRWCAAVSGGPGPVELVIDEERALYAGWGLPKSSLSHFMGRRSMQAVAGLARQGIRNRHPDGTRWQSAGTFGVDRDGVVRWVHLPDHAGRLPDLEAAAHAARRAA